jgi:hypothetical protein
MKRALSLLLVAAIGALAWVLPAPTPPEQVSATTTTAAIASVAATCPWAFSDGGINTFLVAQTGQGADLRFTFPVGGEVRKTVEDVQSGSAATALSLSDVLNQGLAPAVVEFSTGPSAAGVVGTGEGVAVVDTCPSALSKIWHLPGGSTMDGQTLQLVLFNPFSEDARAGVSARSEVGIEPVPELESVTVTGRSWKVIDLARLLPLRQSMSVAVDLKQGAVIPAMVFSEGTDQAVWTVEGQSDQWDFPVADAGGLNPSLVISNDGVIPVDYEIDSFTSGGANVAVATGTVDGSSHLRLDVGDLADGVFGLRVRTGGPVAATLIADDGQRVGATAGIAEPATHWMLPGFGLAGTSTFWVMNTGTETATVTYRLMDSGGALGDPDKVAVPPGTIRSVVPVPVGASGLDVESNSPVSVAWTTSSDGAIGYASGVPVP